jgi:hypothetical protein
LEEEDEEEEEDDEDEEEDEDEDEEEGDEDEDEDEDEDDEEEGKQNAVRVGKPFNKSVRICAKNRRAWGESVRERGCTRATGGVVGEEEGGEEDDDEEYGDESGDMDKEDNADDVEVDDAEEDDDNGEHEDGGDGADGDGDDEEEDEDDEEEESEAQVVRDDTHSGSCEHTAVPPGDHIRSVISTAVLTNLPFANVARSSNAFTVCPSKECMSVPVSGSHN